MLENWPISPEIVVLGTSAGGVDALIKILPAFVATSSLSVVLVIHIPSNKENLVPSLLGPECSFTVKEADSGERILPKTIYVAPPDYHLCLESNGTLSLSNEEPRNFSRPSIDILFESAAFAYPKKVLGVLLTGASDDGALGLKAIQEQGGITMIQDPADSKYSTMPLAALKIIQPDYVLTLDGIANFFRLLSQKR